MKSLFFGLKASAIGLCWLIVTAAPTSAAEKSASVPTPSYTQAELEIINLSKEKWKWMADKNVEKLATLFHDESKFLHMSGTWKKDEELEIIKTGRIWYKDAEVHDTAIEMFDDTAVLWSRITLTAVVGGRDAVTQFTVTEVYKKQAGSWKLLALSFSSVRDTHTIKH